MDNQGIELRTSLCGVDLRDRPVIGGIGAEPVDRLCWERHKFAGPQCAGGFGYVFRREWKDACHNRAAGAP